MKRLVLALVVMVMAATALAELQTVEIGGQLHLRGAGVYGLDAGDRTDFQQRTTLNVTANFSEKVSAFVEFESYDIWGEDFRSNYLTGADARALSNDDVEIYQAFLTVDNLWDTPLKLKVGRQEVRIGDGWLAGNNDNNKRFPGLSVDGIKLYYIADTFKLAAIVAKGAERTGLEQDGDADFYAAIAEYLGMENQNFLAYWIFGRDPRSINDSGATGFDRQLEDWLGVNQYDTTQIHTVGFRAAGALGAFDYNTELAYQFGYAGHMGHEFAGAGLKSPYGDDEARFGQWAGHLDAGYTFDAVWTPRVFLGGAYFGGEDNRDPGFWGWVNSLANPLYKPRASVSFNRLFADYEYGVLDQSDLTNVWLVRGGVGVRPTETLELQAMLTWLETLDAYKAPVSRVLGFWTTEHSRDLGLEANLRGVYLYSQDLRIEAGWSHLFAGDGLKEGNYSSGNGNLLTQNSDDIDYLYLDTQLKF